MRKGAVFYYIIQLAPDNNLVRKEKLSPINLKYFPISLNYIGLRFLATSTLPPQPKDISQRNDTDNHPKQNAQFQGAKPYGLNLIHRERSTDEEHCQD